MKFRKATINDLDAIEGIYDRIHDCEEAGITTIGWIRSIYPKRETAEAALERGDLYVCELTAADANETTGSADAAGQSDAEVRIAATAIINKIQVDVYADVSWAHSVPDEQVAVLHTLVVDPELRFSGIGGAFVGFYEEEAQRMGCTELRMDTNERNAIARKFYAGLGYKEVGIVPTVFNGIPGVNLVMLEKPISNPPR